MPEPEIMYVYKCEDSCKIPKQQSLVTGNDGRSPLNAASDFWSGLSQDNQADCWKSNRRKCSRSSSRTSSVINETCADSIMSGQTPCWCKCTDYFMFFYEWLLDEQQNIILYIYIHLMYNCSLTQIQAFFKVFNLNSHRLRRGGKQNNK